MKRTPPLCRSTCPMLGLFLTVLLAAGLAAGQAEQPPKSKPQQIPALLAVGDESQIAPVPPERAICFALYTVHNGTLKLSAHLYPLSEDEPHQVALDIRQGDQWKPTAEAVVHPIGWTATFRVENWDMATSVPYRVRHASGSTYEGLIRRDPVEKRTIVAAVFTGNSPGPGGGQISKRDVVDNVRKVDPDVLLFTGDQVYNHTQHTAHWLVFGETFGDLMRDRPTVCLPDDHDVGQGNLWGGGGRPVDIDTKGGYTRPAAYVQLVERQQTSHLPDPYDPTPIAQGLGVYYTSLNVGGIDFAIVEDRKFKSGCFDLDIVGRGLGPRPDHIDKSDYNPWDFDMPDKTLLGDRQLKFLRAWGENWDGAVMKAVVSQTVWSMASTYHSSDKTFYYADFDANGWPQSERNQSVDALRRCFALHLCGDQHLATLVQYGIDDWRDSGWSFCVPSIANLWPRWWLPKQEGRNREPGAPEYLGDHLDGFGNKLTVYACTNPHETGRSPAALHDRMPGFGLVDFDKSTRKITMHCWPRMIDPTDRANRGKQYPGWPRTIHQYDNYGRSAAAWLPTLTIHGPSDPVVQVVDEANDQVLYTLRIHGKRFEPKVFHDGRYTIRVGAGTHRVEFRGIAATAQQAESALDVTLRP
ncbi:MAG: hypothetical protein ACYC4U_07000 [Pirellulaceae bacterium]